MNDFEKQLQQQPLRKIPAAWRQEILGDTDIPVCASVKTQTRMSVSRFLWPHPKAWAGLAAAWVLIFALNFASRDTSPAITAAVIPSAFELQMALQQQILFCQLNGFVTPDTDRPKPKSQPRSERRKEQIFV